MNLVKKALALKGVKVLYFVCLIAATFAVLLVALRGTHAEEPKAKADFVGMNECKKCHMKQHMKFKKTGKYKDTWKQIVAEADKELCYSCHTTGFGEPGGFVSADKTPGLQGVQCESCHGPGSLHIKTAKDADSTGISEDPDTLKKIHGAIERHTTRCTGCHDQHIADKAADVRKKAKEGE